jgi:glycosyltransferase involved in cell wall biosynthesis
MGFNNRHDMRVLVCIPAYNESQNIGDVITKVKKYAGEIIVYDDGSTDNTYEIANNSGADVIIRDCNNRGYGAAIKALFLAAKERDADIMVTLDSDGQHDPDQIPAIIEPILNKASDIVIGSRFLTRLDTQKVPKYRYAGIKTITKATQYASYSEITDAQSGFRAYGKRALSNINISEKGMSVSTEILLKAKERNLTIQEVPVTIKYENASAKTSKHNPIKHGAGVLYSILQFMSLRHPFVFYGLPGLVLLIIGAFFVTNALELFSETRYVSLPMILISIGAAVIGVILLATSIILYTLIALFKGRMQQDY